jgi:hypothetical protein
MADAEPHDLMRLEARDRAALESHLPTADWHNARNRHQQRRLPGTVGTDDRHEFSRGHFERHFVERPDRAVARLEVLDLEHRRLHLGISQSDAQGVKRITHDSLPR